MPTLLVIDDEPSILDLCVTLFRTPQTEVQTASTGGQGVALFARTRADVILLDLNLPDQAGLKVFQQIRQLDARVPIIIFTGNGTTSSAIECIALGAHDYVLKPAVLDQLQATVAHAFEVSQLLRGPAMKGKDGIEKPLSVLEAPDTLVGRTPAMQEVYKSIGRVAPQPVTALILGESGTGKELVARAIYQYSPRVTGPFLAVNCAAIPETLLESELFGHERGAFTGADRRRIGKFEQCSGGTLFLDEVGDMTPLTQSKLLRVLQEQAFERVGGSETIRTDARLIAATNRDLERMVAAGQFRKDLYYRLNVYAIRLPTLGERLEDLPLLVKHFLRRFRRELGRDVQGVTPTALELLRQHPWPGNVRELQSVIKHAMLRANGPLLMPEHFLPVLDPVAQPVVNPPATDLDRFVDERLQAGSQNLYAEWRDFTERRLFSQVLRSAEGNLSHAARTLGIHRATLRSRVAALGLLSGRSPEEAS